MLEILWGSKVAAAMRHVVLEAVCLFVALLQLGFGHRNGFERSKDDAGRDRVVLGRDEFEEDLEEGGSDVVRDGEGTREAVGVFVGVLAVEKTTAGGMQP